MSYDHDNLLAFPQPEEWQVCGLTMREYFSAAAVSGNTLGRGSAKDIAEAAYRIADAMLAERKVKREKR